tara:strand:+ start:488 stop:1117 length:630 start_codon:yes stop_codon:yes gene_type:complete
MGLISNGTTLLDAGALDSGVATGALVHIKTLTASGSADLTFVNGAASVVFDGTYKEYLFTFNDIHPAAVSYFSVNFSDDTSSHSYDLTKTGSSFVAWHDEADTATSLQYRTAYDLAQGTGIQALGGDTMSAANDNCGVGFLTVYDPANTTFVKQFTSRFKPNYSGGSDPYTHDGFTSGYVNTTAAVTAVQFKMSTGNIDAGTIKLYGIK